MFKYVHCQPHLVAVAGRALHNYPNPKVHAHQPQLVFLSDEYPDFYQVIFNFYQVIKMKYGQCLFATFFMHFDEFRLQFPTHFIITKLENLLYQYKLRIGTLIDWGKKIKKNFLRKIQFCLSSHLFLVNYFHG